MDAYELSSVAREEVTEEEITKWKQREELKRQCGKHSARPCPCVCVVFVVVLEPCVFSVARSGVESVRLCLVCGVLVVLFFPQLCNPYFLSQQCESWCLLAASCHAPPFWCPRAELEWS